ISQLSPAGVQSLQDAARLESGIRISIGSGQYSVHYVQLLDGFSVEPVRGGLLDRLLGREHRMERRAVALERQLNGGVDFLSSVNNYFQSVMAEHRENKTSNKILMEKINSCLFRPDSNHFSCPESFLTCPITLDTPETGVFMRNSRGAEICSLYDKDALVQLVETGGAHPLSREPITESMIM
ncbi:T3SS effector NleG family protein, partial [Escherichia coli O157:H7]|nr:T3SS effector NleG family protein [Escherichia coli O157:H7]MBL5070302.1 T3SS effector NleG family protein [Escherichia coli O157:H7]MBL5085881.1 T3SS effector NleG family protein [Escherichia coli O157:H7]MBL5096297.1 T3SS effector NleG family protein [Escherichia coli O157:H7]MBL5137913.1 T3SS effector NleG family protein [Escherichia coli O157:H7]